MNQIRELIAQYREADAALYLGRMQNQFLKDVAECQGPGSKAGEAYDAAMNPLNEACEEAMAALVEGARPDNPQLKPWLDKAGDGKSYLEAAVKAVIKSEEG